MTRIAVTALAALVALTLTAATAFVAVIVLAGPHSDLLPAPLQWLVFALGWIAVPCIPALAARAAWRRTARPGH